MVNIADILYFAPGIRFVDIDLNGLGLPDQFKTRILGFYVSPAEECAQHHHAFAAGVLLVTCIDALARLKYGGKVGDRFREFASEQLQSFSQVGLDQRFYDDFRNGLVHEARLKRGAQFSLETGTTVTQFNEILVVNPKYLATEVRTALESYVAVLKRDGAERQKLADMLKQDLEEDLHGV